MRLSRKVSSKAWDYLVETLFSATRERSGFDDWNGEVRTVPVDSLECVYLSPYHMANMRDLS